LAIITSFDDDEQLLGVAESAGTGEDMARSVHNALVEWGIEEQVNAMCFDTTASNTSHKNGACMNLEILLGRN